MVSLHRCFTHLYLTSVLRVQCHLVLDLQVSPLRDLWVSTRLVTVLLLLRSISRSSCRWRAWPTCPGRWPATSRAPSATAFTPEGGFCSSPAGSWWWTSSPTASPPTSSQVRDWPGEAIDSVAELLVLFQSVHFTFNIFIKLFVWIKSLLTERQQ